MWLVKSSADKILTPTAIALGNFDGIHIGHQKVISSIWMQPDDRSGSILPVQKQVKGDPIVYSTVVTFNPHPREYFTGQKKQRLTPLAEKIQVLEKIGIEQLILLPFDRELAALSPQQFVEDILVQKIKAMRISVGQDFRFGCQRAGGAEDLRAIASQYGIEVVITSLQTCAERVPHPSQNKENTVEEVRISSSCIRQALFEGDVKKANRMLGRPYILTGTVIGGQQLGRTIGFPTANLDLPTDKLLPRYGVYCVRVAIKDEQGDNAAPVSLNGVMNIGYRPTVEGDGRPTVEVHLLDWSGDLYGRCLTVSLEEFIRPEAKFPSIEALKAQIKADCELARKILQV